MGRTMREVEESWKLRVLARRADLRYPILIDACFGFPTKQAKISPLSNDIKTPKRTGLSQHNARKVRF